MNINLRQLRAFVSIGRLGSFTKAADALHATQPALSAHHAAIYWRSENARKSSFRRDASYDCIKLFANSIAQEHGRRNLAHLAFNLARGAIALSAVFSNLL